jgi:hypothetical protein
MKRKLILALLILAVSTSFVFAGAFGAGVSAGGSLSFVATDSASDGAPRYGFTGGIYGDYAFYSMENVMDLSVQPGVNFAMKGFNTDAPHDSSITMDVNLNYIEVPVLFKASFPLEMPVAPYVVVGPYAGYSISKNLKFSDDVPSATEDFIASSSIDDVQDFDFGVVMGAGVDLEMGISIDARFSMGLIEIGEDTVDWKNRSVSLMVSYNIL